MSTSIKSIVAGGLIAAGALTGTIGAAEAHHHGKNRFVIVLGAPKDPCDYYYWKWLKTGKYEWKSAYYQCIGW